MSSGAFTIAHGLQWLSLKAYDHSNFRAHRANKTRRKKYLTNGVGYVYDYLVGKIQQIKAERTK
jgi:hypothetical protein